MQLEKLKMDVRGLIGQLCSRNAIVVDLVATRFAGLSIANNEHPSSV